MELSRRQVLLGSMTVPLLSWVSQLQLAAQPATWEVGAREIRYFSSDFTSVYRLVFPGAVEMHSGSGPSPRVLNISASADPRIVSAADAVSPTSLDDAAVGVLTAQDSIAADYRAALNPLHGDWRDVAIALPFVVRPLYPHDGIDGAAGVDFDVNSSQKNGIASSSEPELFLSGGLAWGATLSVGWTNAKLDGAHGTVSVPAYVRCTSVGPGEVPAGSTIRIVADKGCVESVAAVRTGMPVDTVFSDFYDEVHRDSASRLETEVTVVNAIPAGHTVLVNFVSSFVTEPANMGTTTTVSFVAPDGSGDWQRQTRGEVARNAKTVADLEERVARGNR